MLYSRLKSMEININCDLGEKSKFHSIKNDPELLNIVNSANIACGYHAGDEQTMDMVIQISRQNGVSIGAHPSFNDPENFGRKRMNLNSLEIKKLIFFLPKFSGSLNEGWAPILTLFFLDVLITIFIVSSSPA